MITGGCLCGKIRFEIDGKLGAVVYCHCSQCRRAAGSAFAANAPVRRKYFRFVSGEDLVTEYESSAGKLRAFCRNCGSPIYSRRPAVPDTLRIRLGTLDGDPERRAVAHIYVGSKAPWFEITDALPQYDTHPPVAEGESRFAR